MSVGVDFVDRTGIAPSAAAPQSRADTCRRGPAVGPVARGSTIEFIDDLDSFLALEAEWNALHDANRRNQLAFQSFEWIRAWLTTYLADPGDQAQTAAIVIVRTDRQLRLACPLAVKRVLGLRCLTWLGEPASQYGDILSDGTPASDALIDAALAYAIERTRPDLVHLRKVRDDAAILPWLNAQAAGATAHDAAPCLDLHEATSFDDYCKRYSAKARKNRRRLRRRLAESGAVTTTVLETGAAAREAIRTGIAFKQAWLVDRGHVSSGLHDVNMSRFLEEFVSRPSPFAPPFVSVMACGKTPVSVQFGLQSPRGLALHLIAYNPQMEKAGAGILHIEDTLAYCIAQGLPTLDFLAPDAPYKRAWADTAMAVSDYTIARTVKGQLFAHGYLGHARDLLKSRVAALPLSFRRTIARRFHSPAN